MPIRHRFTSAVPDGGDTSLVRPSNWNDTHVFPWRQVTAGETLAASDPIAATISTAQTFPLPASIAAGDVFELRNNSNSTALASIDPGAGRQIQGCPVADTLTLAAGETAALVARSTTFFELLTPGAVGPQGPQGPQGIQGPEGPQGPAVPLSSSTPAALGSAAVGVATTAARADHVHAMPSAANVGAAPSSHVGSGGAEHAVATTSVAGFMAAADKTKLDGVATGATANATDASLRDRSTHTGSQAASTISDFAASVRAQIEAALLAGANVTITPAGSGATRTLSLASTGGGGGGSPGGTAGQVQFNNSGVLGGAALTTVDAGGRIVHGSYYDVADISNPAAPASGFLRMFARAQAGRMLPAFVGPSGLDSNLQPALFRNTIYMWLPGTGTTVAINFGTSWTARNSGTGAAQAHPTKASTNALTSMNRATFGTGTTATGTSGIQSAATVAWRGNAAGLGGFFYFSRFGVETFRSDIQVLNGLSALNAALAGEPSVQNNSIGVCKDSADTNWQVFTRSGTTTTKTDTGVAVAAGTILDLMMFAPPNGSTVTVRLVNAVTGAVIVDDLAISTNLPVNTTFLYAHAQIRSTTGTTAALLALNRIYVETDL